MMEFNLWCRKCGTGLMEEGTSVVPCAVCLRTALREGVQAGRQQAIAEYGLDEVCDDSSTSGS